MRALAGRLLRDERGQGMVEYALIAGALAVGMIVSIRLLGGAFGLAYGHHAKGLMRAR
ncbi:Flp/Fap pilin component [compost metagenome]